MYFALILFFPSRCVGVANAQELEFKPFDVTSDTEFRNYRQVVSAFAGKHRPAVNNRFCVIGFQTPDQNKVVWVLWKNGGHILLWEGQSDLDFSRRNIDLKSDVVATQEALRGSTYLVTRSWVDNLSKTCSASGVEVIIPKTAKSSNRNLNYEWAIAE